MIQVRQDTSKDTIVVHFVQGSEQDILNEAHTLYIQDECAKY